MISGLLNRTPFVLEQGISEHEQGDLEDDQGIPDALDHGAILQCTRQKAAPRLKGCEIFLCKLL